MKINLKKAGALAVAVAAVKTPVNTTFSVDPYGDVPSEESVQNLQQEFRDSVMTTLSLYETVYLLRKLIGEANVEKVNGLLSQRALVEKQLSLMNSIPLREKGTNLNVLARKVEAMREKVDNQVYGRNPLTLELETDSLVGPLVRQMKRRLRDLDDELQKANYNTEIEIPENVVEVLKTLDLV